MWVSKEVSCLLLTEEGTQSLTQFIPESVKNKQVYQKDPVKDGHILKVLYI